MSTSIIKRDSNFELLRIICMVMVIMGHLGIKFSSGIINSLAYIETHLLRSFTIVAVNVFVLISGYFSISYKMPRLLKLIEQTWFYSVGLFILALLLGWHSLEPRKDIFYFVPIFGKLFWFITIYVILYILSPILNNLALSLTKKKFKAILLVGFFIIYVWHTFGYILNAQMPFEDAGYGVPNFIYLYLLGRYFRMHFDITSSKHNYFLFYVLISLALFSFQYAYSWVLGFSFTSLFSYNILFVFWGAVMLFLSFAKLKLAYNKFINEWAKYCLAVYIIHMHPLIWDKICSFIHLYEVNPIWFIPYAILISVVLYFILATVERIRVFLLGGLEDRLNGIIENSKIATKVNNIIKLDV